jgi:hypothetical protein
MLAFPGGHDHGPDPLPSSETKNVSDAVVHVTAFVTYVVFVSYLVELGHPLGMALLYALVTCAAADQVARGVTAKNGITLSSAQLSGASGDPLSIGGALYALFPHALESLHRRRQTPAPGDRQAGLKPSSDQSGKES